MLKLTSSSCLTQSYKDRHSLGHRRIGRYLPGKCTRGSNLCQLECSHSDRGHNHIDTDCRHGRPQWGSYAACSSSCTNQCRYNFRPRIHCRRFDRSRSRCLGIPHTSPGVRSHLSQSLGRLLLKNSDWCKGKHNHAHRKLRQSFRSMAKCSS